MKNNIREPRVRSAPLADTNATAPKASKRAKSPRTGKASKAATAAEKLRAGQERLREAMVSETRWRTLAENAPAFITILDRDGTILNVNHDVFGIPPKELIGASTFSFFPPEGQAVVRHHLAKIFEHGEKGRHQVNSTLPTGEPVWLEVSYAPIFENGVVSGAISVSIDITAQKKVEAELMASQARLYSILENVPEIVTTLDARGTILSVNRSIGPFSPTQLVGQNVLSFVPPDKIEQSRQSLARVFREHQAISYDIEIPSITGKVQWLQVKMGPVSVADKVDTAVAVLVDVTKEKEQQIALRRAYDEMEERVLERTADLSAANAALQQYAATQSELAAENRRLAQSLKEQLDVTETLNEVALVLGKTLDSNAVLDGILVHAQRFVPFDAANVMLMRDGMAQIVRAIGYEKFGVTEPERIELEIAETPFLGQILKTGEPVIVPDIQTISGWIPVTETSWMHSYACVPMRAQDEIFGFLNVDSVMRDAFTQEHVRLLQALATLGAVALNNARLYENERSSAQELQALSRALVQQQENERRRISRELHDEIGQALTGQLVALHFMEKNLSDSELMAQRIVDIKYALNDVLEEVHRLTMNLRPAALDHLGFTAAVEQYIEAFQQQHPELQVDSHIVQLVTERLPIEMAVALYRIVQESLTNIARHAHASKVEVAITKQKGRIAVVIWDNGVGFVPEMVNGTQHQGLAGMKERAKMLGGTLEIESAPNQGTMIQVEVVHDH